MAVQAREEAVKGVLGEISVRARQYLRLMTCAAQYGHLPPESHHRSESMIAWLGRYQQVIVNRDAISASNAILQGSGQQIRTPVGFYCSFNWRRRLAHRRIPPLVSALPTTGCGNAGTIRLSNFHGKGGRHL